MVTPDKIRLQAAKIGALTEAFEHTYLHFVDLGEGEMEERNKGAMAFYALKDLLQQLMADADELCDHMEVCNAVFAVQHIRKGGKLNAYQRSDERLRDRHHREQELYRSGQTE